MKNEKEDGWMICAHCSYKWQDYELERLLKK